MSANENGKAAAASPTPRKLKILMLHGYTQSGPLFHSKTRALEKALTKAFPSPAPPPHKPLPGTLPSYPGGIQLIYPTAPIRLHPADIPGFNSSSAEEEKEAEEPDAWGWWKKSDEQDGLYIGLEDGFETIRQTIEDAGGVDGVIGFSQGGAMAALLASLLESGRQASFPSNVQSNPKAFPYPSSYTTLTTSQQPLKFAVSYSGFYAPHPAYKAFYEPKISTRFLHVLGSLDSVVEEERSEGLVERCADKERVVHPGGHFVPVGKEMAGVLVGFLRDVLGREEGEKKEEGGVEDMDVPF